MFVRMDADLYHRVALADDSGSIQPAGCDGGFDLANGLGDLDLARAGHAAVENGMAAMDAGDLVHDLQPFSSGLVAVVKDKPVRSHDGGRADVVITAPKGWAGSGAAGTQDALGGVVEAQARFRALIAFLLRLGIIVDEPRLDRAVVCKERLHIHDQVFHHGQAQDGFDGDLRADITHKGLAGQTVHPIDAHRIGPADAVCARPAEG